MQKGKILSQVDIGNTVLCDLCNADYTDSNESGGFLFLSSTGVCPKCAPEFLKNIESYHEEKYIRAWCSDHLSFKDFIIKIRGGNNLITVHEAIL